MKVCKGCGIGKPESEFRYHAENKDKLTGKCSDCLNKDHREYLKRTHNATCKKYEKTPKGFLMRTYRNMESRVTGIQKLKAHLYQNLELLDRESFYQWALSSEDFYNLYNAYCASGYQMKLAPSIDRIDSSKGYTFDNIRWITHSENSRLGALSRFNNKRIYNGKIL